MHELDKFRYSAIKNMENRDEAEVCMWSAWKESYMERDQPCELGQYAGELSVMCGWEEHDAIEGYQQTQDSEAEMSCACLAGTQ